MGNRSVFTFSALLLLFIFLWAIKIFNISYPISVTTRSVSGELAVVGDGKVDVVPDTASVSVGIVVSSTSTVAQAQKGISDVNNKIVSALTKLGINKKDIKTSDYSINPNYNYQNGQNNINGYNGNATLTIKVTDPSKLPQVIEAATNSGANQVYNTTYSIDNPDKYREEARAQAIDNAKAQAQKLAGQLGIHLGKIVNIVESTPNSQGPVPLMYKDLNATGGGANSAPDLQAGSQTITSTVTLYFEKN